MSDTSSNDLSYDVRLYKPDEYVGKRKTTHRVRWAVAGKMFAKTHATKKLAESFQAKLTTAAREGVPFDVRSGLPAPMAKLLNRRSWFQHACEYVDIKWPHISPGHRRGISETLTQATLSLLAAERGRPDDALIRRALHSWAFSKTARDGRGFESATPPKDLEHVVIFITGDNGPTPEGGLHGAILELVGVPEPTRVNGIDQMPMHGVSMAYTFDDATAPDRHTTQYFELTGSRAIYQDGWWAGTRHGLDGVTAAAKQVVPFEEDAWELYDLRNDFGHATNLAAQHPERLAELQALFDHEARTYNVYPMVNNAFDLLTAKRPRLVSGNRASYSAGTIRLPEDGVIDIKNRSFSVIADVDSDGDAEGMLVTLGGETGGFAFYVLEGTPTFQYNWLGKEHYTITSSQALPKGPSTIRFDFAYDGGGPGKGGTGTLRLDGEAVGNGRIDKTVPVYFSTDDTFDVGEDWGTPVSPAYKPPFRFTGTLKTVTIDADPQ